MDVNVEYIGLVTVLLWQIMILHAKLYKAVSALAYQSGAGSPR